MSDLEMCNLDPNCLGVIPPHIAIILVVLLIFFCIGLFGICSSTGWD